MLRSFRRYANYSASLHLPKTQFSPKIPSGEEASKIQEIVSKNLYEFQYKDTVSREKKFILHDGPPYANGDLHLGHALNKVLKDIINRYEMFYNGKTIDYVPGWDCHGLPIELKVSKPEYSAQQIREKSRELANSMIASQKEQFKQFSIMTNWEKIYKTMNHEYEVNQLKLFNLLIKNSLLTRQMKPVWYGCDTKTALAEAELEYKKHNSIAVTVKFPVVGQENTHLVIWTSTPWTLLGNKAICVNEKLNYVKLVGNVESLIVQEDLVSSIKNHQDYKVVKLPIDELMNYKYSNLYNEECPVLHGDHVNNSSGTGLVHTAPGHGMEDYLVGLKNGLEIDSIVDDEGRLLDPDFPDTPVNRVETIKKCLKIYGQKGIIHDVDYKFVHNYPYDWRSKTPVIQRATPQWFINVDKIRNATLEALESVEFVPEIGVNRLKAFILNRTEWCISRQRAWGVPLPIIYYEGKPLYDIIESVIQKFDEFGTDEWFNEDIEKWLPDGYASKNNLSLDKFSKSRDTMDVWFDSGTSWTTLNGFNADVYLEGSDQHRGWFQSSILNKIISTGKDGEFESTSPYRKIVTHGFILDKNNDKMSKSLGNVIAPGDLINGNMKIGVPKLGIDGLRLWIASSNYVNDISISNEILKRVLDNLKKFRVTFKFILGNLSLGEISLSYKDLNNLDKYVLSSLKKLQLESKQNFKEYNFQKIIKDVNNHMNNEMSSFYFDISKDCLYTDSLSSVRRQNIQFVLREVLKTYISILSPILPDLSQEVWQSSKHIFASTEVSPFMLPYSYFELPQSYLNKEVEVKFDFLMELRNRIFGKLESLRKDNHFKKNLELSLFLNTDNLIVLENLNILDDFFLVSQVYTGKPDKCIGSFELDSIEVSVAHSEYHKCPRCWKYTAAEEEELCKKCDSVVN